MLSRALVRAVLVIVAGLPGGWAHAQPARLDLTDEQRAWIRLNPVVKVAVMANLEPIEYVEKGRILGLSGAMLEEFSRKTGLTFLPVPATSSQQRVDLLKRGDVDLISSMRTNSELAGQPGLMHTAPYHVSSGLVITRINKPFIFEPEQLNGMTVTFSYQSFYLGEIKRRAPDARLIVGGTASRMLQQVRNGEADAALGIEIFLVPSLYREQQGHLQISGVMPGMASEIGMTVRSDQPMLHAILQQAIGSLSPDELQQVHTNWLDRHIKNEPTLTALIEDYPHELALFGVVVLLLSAVAVQMHRTRQRAERNEQEKTMFLAVMSHEIRSPMNSVLAAVELLRNTPLAEQQRHYADLANKGAQSLLTLIDDVLDLTKLEAGQLKLEPDPVDIATLIHDTVELHELRARERHLSLGYDGPAEPPLLMLDDARLGQILHNLLSNAIKFTETGGVTVRYSVDESPIPKHMTLKIQVIDTGPGMSEDAQGKLFLPYAQMAGTFKRSGGTGLGLAITRDLVNLMQGTITVDSVQGKGTTFEIILPAQVAPKSAQAYQPPAEPTLQDARPASGLRVLVVEDTPANQAVLQAQLEGFGCTAVLAQDGAQAVACFSQGAYDLVLMDCDLPDRNGYDLTAELREIEKTSGQAHCPVIAISASTGTDHVTRCFDSGMDGILSKPIRLRQLQDTIELWCGVELAPISAPAGIDRRISLDQVRDTLKEDMTAILQSTAIRNVDDGLKAAHRLRGAALAVDWPEVVHAVESVEALLNGEVQWNGPELSDALHELARQLAVSRPQMESLTEQ